MGSERTGDYNTAGPPSLRQSHPPAIVQCWYSAAVIIECIPNVSEGRRQAIVDEIAAAIRGTAGGRLLDSSSDASHNRPVFALAGDAAGVEQAVMALYECALPAIDLRTHRGEHPRIGAVDVVPFVPIEGATMDDCVALARKVGGAIADRFQIPVFLYEEAAAN